MPKDDVLETHALRGIIREERRASSPNPSRAGCTRDGVHLRECRRSRQRRLSDAPGGVTSPRSSHLHRAALPYAGGEEAPKRSSSSLEVRTCRRRRPVAWLLW